MQRASGTIGFPAPTLTFLFPKGLRGFHVPAFPWALASSGSSFHALFLLFRVRFRPRPADRACTLSTFLEVFLSIAIPARRIYLWQASQARLAPLSAFLPLSVVSSSSCLVGLFHPATASEICLSRVFPAINPTHLFGALCPPDVLTEFFC
jgi:hypothetical protein